MRRNLILTTALLSLLLLLVACESQIPPQLQDAETDYPLDIDWGKTVDLPYYEGETITATLYVDVKLYEDISPGAPREESLVAEQIVDTGCTAPTQPSVGRFCATGWSWEPFSWSGDAEQYLRLRWEVSNGMSLCFAYGGLYDCEMGVYEFYSTLPKVYRLYLPIHWNPYIFPP